MSTQCAFSATRLVLRRTTTTSAFRCASEVTQRLSTATTRTARTTTQAQRYYGAPAYHSYSLPTHTGPPPPLAEGQDFPLPKVNETRPPKQTPAQQAQVETIESSTTLEMPSRTTTETTPKTPTPAPTTAAATPASAPATKRPRSKLRARKAAMKLTPSAVKQLRMMLDDPEPKLIKVGVRNRGCSGLAYHLAWVDKPGPFDEEVVQDGVKVLIDSKALFSIIGSEMDWVEDKLSQKFVFKNPNIKEECGCGESFMV